MRNKRIVSLLFIVLLLVVSCSIVKQVSIQSDINADKEILVGCRTDIVVLRSEIVRNETIPISRIVTYYESVFKGLIHEYNFLAEEAKQLTSEDMARWQEWRIRVQELRTNVDKVERIYENEIHGG